MKRQTAQLCVRKILTEAAEMPRPSKLTKPWQPIYCGARHVCTGVRRLGSLQMHSAMLRRETAQILLVP